MSDPIIDQIETLGSRRLLSCAGRFLIVFFVCCVLFGLVVRQAQDKHIRTAAAFAAGGLVMGFATSILTSRSRKLLKTVFVVFPLVIAIVLFAYRTLFGMSSHIPLRLVIVPLCLTAGFLIGQVGRNNRRL